MAVRIWRAPAGSNPLAGVMDWWRLLVAYVATMLRTRRKAHQEEEKLLKGEDALTVQPKLALALGSIDAAFIVQKLYAWMRFNEKQQSKFHYRQGKWWTFNSYPEWKENHFSWMSVSKISRAFRELEKQGIVVSGKFRKERGDQRKWYTLDYGALNAAVAKWNHHRVKSSGHDSILESSSRQNGTMNQQEKSTKQKSQGREFQASNSSLPAWKPRPPAAVGSPSMVSQKMALPNVEVPAAPPVSGLPPSPYPPPIPTPVPCPVNGEGGTAAALVDEIVAAWGGALTAKTAEKLIALYGENRVRGVVYYARDTRRGKLDNPPGFVIDELREDKYGIVPVGASITRDDVNAEALADWQARRERVADDESLIPSALDTPRDKWLAAYQQLELLLDRASFDTWLRPARFVDYEAGVFTIKCHSTYARDMLQHRLYRNVRRVLSDVWGEPVEIQFVVQEVQDAA